MYCQNRMVHTVQEGDSLYRLARQYHTTVTELILGCLLYTSDAADD